MGKTTKQQQIKVYIQDVLRFRKIKPIDQSGKQISDPEMFKKILDDAVKRMEKDQTRTMLKIKLDKKRMFK